MCIWDCFLQQCFMEPNQEQVILDLDMCNEERLIKYLVVKYPPEGSDCNVITFYMCEHHRSKTAGSNFNKGNYKSMYSRWSYLK